MTTITRVPVQVPREPIKVLSEMGHKTSGGWFIYKKPDESPPAWRTKKDERILWCPYCGEWEIYKKPFGEDKWSCLGYCGWSNTNDYWVKMVNSIWFEDVPLSAIQGIVIPTSRAKKR